MYGRKVVLQFALVLFLIGSALCGLSQSLAELVAFRAIQGLGGGGLMVGAMAAIGRRRLAARARPLPGAVRGCVRACERDRTAARRLLHDFAHVALDLLHQPTRRGCQHSSCWPRRCPPSASACTARIDYAGAALLAAALVGIVLVCTFGGVNFAWLSPFIISLGIFSILLVVAFVYVEGRAAEPILPPHLFRNRVFNVTSAIGFVVGFALFGSVTYLALFLQVVNGASPTGSGLQILPLMAGLLITSIGSGQAITRTGKYKVFPIVGTFVMIIGLYLLSRMDASTSRLTASAYMFVLGLGLGMVMQVLVLAVQNAVDYKDLGVATSGATLFRSIGGSVGTAILGSIFASGLKSNLTAGLHAHPQAVAGLPHSQIAKLSGAIGNPQSLKAMPTPLHDLYISSFTSSLNTVFEVAAGDCRRSVLPEPGAPGAAAARHRRGECRDRRVLRRAEASRFARGALTGTVACWWATSAAASSSSRSPRRPGSTSHRPRPGCSCAGTASRRRRSRSCRPTGMCPWSAQRPDCRS